MESGPITGKKANSAPKKRVKHDDTAVFLPKKRKGKLENLMTMPLDVLFEILSHLLPSDLLKLTRLNKEFRRILMNRSSISVWKAARFNACELPGPPGDMSEPAWASLAFSSLCHVCGVATVRNIDWALLKRICKDCFRDTLLTKRCDPTLAALLPARTRAGKKYYYGPQYRALLAERQSIGSNAEELQCFLAKKRSELKDILAHEQLCMAWEQICVAEKDNERNYLKDQRYNAVVDKLRDLGWGKELDMPLTHEKLLQHRLVTQPIRLTPRIWTNIEKPLLEVMAECRAHRLYLERVEFAALINKRKEPALSILHNFKMKQLPYTELMPSSVDFCSFDTVKTVLELPSEVTVNQSSFDHIIPLLPQLFQEWQQEKLNELQAIVYKDSSHGNVNLAISIFSCSHCLGDYGRPSRSLEFYPEVMVHECTTVREYRPDYRTSNDDVATRLDAYDSYEYYKRHAWGGCSILFVRAKNVDAVKCVVKAVGLDPNTATVEEMDRLGKRFVCETCIYSQSGARVDVLGWRVAVEHVLRVHSDDSAGAGTQDPYDFDAISWKILDVSNVPDDAIQTEFRFIDQRYLDEIPIFFSSPRKVLAEAPELGKWRCAHCMDLPSEVRSAGLKTIKKHLYTRHGIRSAKENQDYFIPFPPKFKTISSGVGAFFEQYRPLKRRNTI